MYELHGLLVFDRHARDDLKSRVREATISARLKYTAGGTALRCCCWAEFTDC